MDSLAPEHTITSSLGRGEISFSITGFWDFDAIQGFHSELDKHAWPMVKAGKKIHVIGDMDGFVTQSRQTGNAIAAHLARSQEFNLSRIAIYNASSLVKLQYERISNGIDVGFFANRTEALGWIRRPYADVV